MSPGVCLGCAATLPERGDCERCFNALMQFTEQRHHWPLEVSLSSAALAWVERAVRRQLTIDPPTREAVTIELQNLANVIRSHGQHTIERAREAAAHDPLLD